MNGEECSTTGQFFRARVPGALQGERKILERYDNDAKTVGADIETVVFAVMGDVFQPAASIKTGTKTARPQS